MPRAEAQAGVQNNHLLAVARRAAAPARFDQEKMTDLNRLEMALPGFSPILARQPFDDDFPRGGI